MVYSSVLVEKVVDVVVVIVDVDVDVVVVLSAKTEKPIQAETTTTCWKTDDEKFFLQNENNCFSFVLSFFSLSDLV